MVAANFARQKDRPETQVVNQLLRSDVRRVPDSLLNQSVPDLGTADVPREQFFSQDYYEKECKRLWPKVWQAVCREVELPKVGSYMVYDVGDASIIVVRSAADKIRAFHNACLHRGTQLRDRDGFAREFKCPFHGWTWEIAGSIKEIPCRWDFEHVNNEDFDLLEVKVETWQGIVFVNFDPNSEPLSAHVESVAAHFDDITFPLSDRFTALRIVKVMPANWKVTLEAFVESYHFPATHPQVLPFASQAQYDIYGKHSRTILPVAVQHPSLQPPLDEATLAKKIAAFEGEDPAQVNLPKGMSARSFAAAAARARFQQQLHVDCTSLLDTEALDVMSYFIFPNLVITPSLGFPLMMTFRPYENSPELCQMEVRVVLPCPPDTTPPALPTHYLGIEDSWTTVPGFERIGPVFDQDAANLKRLQRGLRASHKPGVTLSRYQESSIRNFHQVLAQQLAVAN